MIVFYDFEMLEEFDFEEGFFVDDIKIFLSNYFLFENLEINELQKKHKIVSLSHDDLYDLIKKSFKITHSGIKVLEISITVSDPVFIKIDQQIDSASISEDEKNEIYKITLLDYSNFHQKYCNYSKKLTFNWKENGF